MARKLEKEVLIELNDLKLHYLACGDGIVLPDVNTRIYMQNKAGLLTYLYNWREGHYELEMGHDIVQKIRSLKEGARVCYECGGARLVFCRKNKNA